jgi:hypothetical protein
MFNWIFFFIEDMDPRPVLHVRDTSSGLSACAVLSSRDMDAVCCMFESIWIYIHGPPLECSGDPEFNNPTCRSYLERHNISFHSRPARRHNKTGSVESGHSSIKLLARRLTNDLEMATMTMGLRPIYPEIISQATYLRNILCRGRILSSFEQARGYQPYKDYFLASWRRNSSRRMKDKLLEEHYPYVALSTPRMRTRRCVWVRL